MRGTRNLRIPFSAFGNSGLIVDADHCCVVLADHCKALGLCVFLTHEFNISVGRIVTGKKIPASLHDFMVSFVEHHLA